MPEPRKGGPVMPQSMASSGDNTPMPMVRRFQMRLFVSSDSYSSTAGSNLWMNSSRLSSQPGGRSSGMPPMRMQLSVIRAPQYISNRSSTSSRSRKQ